MTPAFDAYVAPARARPQIWRVLVGLVVTLIVYIVLTVAVIAAGWWIVGADVTLQAWAEDVIRAQEPAPTLTLLATFLGLALGVIVAARLLHGRGYASLRGPRAAFWRDAGIAACVVAFIYLLGVAVFAWPSLTPNVAPGLWLSVLPLALVAIAIQIGAEELVFRGYLQQQLAARFPHRAVWLVGPAVLFGVLHYAEPAGANAWLVALAATVFGLIAGDLTARTGNLGAACGFHFVNNVVALLIIGVEGSLSGLSLYLSPITMTDVVEMRREVLLSIALTLAAWLALRVVLRR